MTIKFINLDDTASLESLDPGETGFPDLDYNTELEPLEDSHQQLPSMERKKRNIRRGLSDSPDRYYNPPYNPPLPLLEDSPQLQKSIKSMQTILRNAGFVEPVEEMMNSADSVAKQMVWLENNINALVLKYRDKPDSNLAENIFHRIQLWGGITGRAIYVRGGGFHDNFSIKTYEAMIYCLLKGIETLTVSELAQSLIGKEYRIPRLGVSFATKHFRFWSNNLLPIYDNPMAQGAQGRKLAYWGHYPEFVRCLQAAAQQKNVTDAILERHLFNFFQSEKGVQWKNCRFPVPDNTVHMRGESTSYNLPILASLPLVGLPQEDFEKVLPPQPTAGDYEFADRIVKLKPTGDSGDSGDSGAGGTGDHQVNFSAMAQGQLEAGDNFILDIWAHTESQTEQVKVRGNEMGRGDLKGIKQGVEIVQGSVLEVHLSLPGFEVSDPVDFLTWNGDPVNASFPVTAPQDCPEGSHLGTATISSHGLMICKLHFQIEIGAGARAASEDLTIKTECPRTAFASYSSQNQAEVAVCIQGMQKVAPEMDVDIDALSLRSGQNWREALGRLIPAKDVFFLFWSKPASESKEVEWEWRLALDRRGIDYIDPVPLVDPKEVPPPAELASLHFNDKWLAFMKSSGR